MARARNIKPGFFVNERLVDLPYSTRLLFIGLWTLADREGRLEDRAKKIKMELFPADDIDVDEALSTLVASAFIQRYRVGELACIQVVNFTKHQRPHSNEAASTLPPPPREQDRESGTASDIASVYAGDSGYFDQGAQDVQPRVKALRPDTGYLNDDSPSRIPDSLGGRAPAPAASPPNQSVTFPSGEQTNVTFAFADDDPSRVEVTFDSVPESGSPPRAKRPEKRATGTPAAFAPTDEQYEWAEKEFEMLRAEIDWETRKFLDYHQARGSTQKDWAAAWRYWIRKSSEYNKPSALSQIGRAAPLSRAAKARQQVEHLRRQIAEDEGHDENRSSEIGGHHPHRMAAGGS